MQAHRPLLLLPVTHCTMWIGNCTKKAACVLELKTKYSVEQSLTNFLPYFFFYSRRPCHLLAGSPVPASGSVGHRQVLHCRLAAAGVCHLDERSAPVRPQHDAQRGATCKWLTALHQGDHWASGRLSLYALQSAGHGNAFHADGGHCQRWVLPFYYLFKVNYFFIKVRNLLV